jgi:hypothetical protein
MIQRSEHLMWAPTLGGRDRGDERAGVDRLTLGIVLAVMLLVLWLCAAAAGADPLAMAV